MIILKGFNVNFSFWIVNITERKQFGDNCGCGVQAIKDHSNVDKSLLAVDIEP
jgi:hypothetical protein